MVTVQQRASVTITGRNIALQNFERRRGTQDKRRLPLFPSPTAPDAPSKFVLAVQGVDKALLQAEVIDPATVLPVLPSGEDEQTGLTERTRKRLLELGISELFAVQTALLPFIIYQNLRTSPLCRTSSVPLDVCVSAPTGSGKTLAYVLQYLCCSPELMRNAGVSMRS
ncbi:hypothetical protein EDC04DRAFT_3150668 [Pisolithus marmoratus]|nr:hypothetical protein EDC04DRAFT_3150668 [Pisolithus marmoratus]